MFTDYFWSLETAEQAIGTEPYDPAIAHNTDLGFFIDRLILAKTQPEMFVLHIAITLLGIYIIFSIPPFTGLAFKLRCYCAGTMYVLVVRPLLQCGNFRHFWSTREAKVGTTDCQPPAHLDVESESEATFLFLNLKNKPSPSIPWFCYFLCIFLLIVFLYLFYYFFDPIFLFTFQPCKKAKKRHFRTLSFLSFYFLPIAFVPFFISPSRPQLEKNKSLSLPFPGLLSLIFFLFLR
eukprot:TRINITY_DN1225_c0_g1_i10.p1 TRINITY_DN1225_c0_g1~~TRINITY_DN1225_c0_g1_i10.p1  ORF type:complete len:235 (+),score=9.82 TRINITY_DN1225_c0_g1_i10:42-746(+)